MENTNPQGFELKDEVVCYNGTPVAEMTDEAAIKAIEVEGVDAADANTPQAALEEHYHEVISKLETTTDAVEPEEELEGDVLRAKVLAEAEEAKPLANHNVPELRELCKAAGVDASGNRAALLAAIQGEKVDDADADEGEQTITGYKVTSPIKEDGKMLKVGSKYKGENANQLFEAGCLEPLFESK